MQDINSYERMLETIALLKILAHGKAQIEAGEVRDTADVIAGLRAERSPRHTRQGGMRNRVEAGSERQG